MDGPGCVCPQPLSAISLAIPPVAVSLKIAGQPVALTISGNISRVPARRGEIEQSFHWNLRRALAHFQNR